MFRNLLNRFRGASAPNGIAEAHPFDLDQAIILDAEDLAEQGIADAYARLLPSLSEHVPSPAPVADVVDEEAGAYAVRVGEELRVVYSPDEPGSDEESWGRATFLFFDLVNRQLQTSDVRLYALNGGNDLMGIFLAPAEAEAACARLPRRNDWPYLPTAEAPWYGQPH